MLVALLPVVEHLGGEPTVVDELPPAIIHRALEDDVVHVEPPLVPPVAYYNTWGFDDLPPARADRELADVTQTFSPIALFPTFAVLDALVPASGRRALEDDVVHVEPPVTPVAYYNTWYSDELPTGTLGRPPDATLTTFAPGLATFHGAVVDESPWTTQAALATDVVHVEPIVVVLPETGNVVDDAPWPGGRFPIDGPLTTFAPGLAAFHGAVVDDAPWRTPALLVDGAQHVEPIAIVLPETTNVVDDAPWPGGRFPIDGPLTTFAPGLATFHGAVLDDAPWHTPATIATDVVRVEPITIVLPETTNVVDDPPWPGGRFPIDGPLQTWSPLVVAPHAVGFDDAPWHRADAWSDDVHVFAPGLATFHGAVVDELAPASRYTPGDETVRVEPITVVIPETVNVVDDPPWPAAGIVPGSELTIVEPPSIIVPFFCVVDEMPWSRVAQPPDFDFLRRRPPRPRPRPQPATAGSGGIGGGGWSYCGDVLLDPLCDPAEPGLVEQELGATPSIPETLAGLLGRSATGFAIGKTATKVAREHFGKPGAAVAAVGSVVATAKLAKHKKTGKVQKLLVFGNALAALDDLVNLATESDATEVQTPTGKARLELVLDPVTFVKRAKELRGDVKVSRLTGSDAAGEPRAKLRYTVSGGSPLTLVVYEETLRMGPDGRFDARESLLAAIRKHRG